MNPAKISIQIAILNGKSYIQPCLESILAQTCDPTLIELVIWDNGSTDGTIQTIEKLLPKFHHFAHTAFIQHGHNLGMWGAQEKILGQTASEIVVFLSADVILDQEFVTRALHAFEKNPSLGALQAKTYRFDLHQLESGLPLERTVIDTCGFALARSRRIFNIGHGEIDSGQFSEPKEIFGIEGAVPIFRRQALESIRVLNEIADHDLFWYAEDLDVAWRIRLAGWKEMFEPNLIAWHDRQTTKSHTHGGWGKYITRVPIRQQIPLKKRRLEWRNTRWTFIKNDYIINILQDLPYILWREVQVLGYTVLFEPGVLKELPAFLKGIPRMLQKRRMIFGNAKASPASIHSFFL